MSFVYKLFVSVCTMSDIGGCKLCLKAEGVSVWPLQAKDMQQMVKLEAEMDRRPATVV